MILDLEELEAENSLRCQICIIGSGAAGITLALQLQKTFEDILMLEGGGASFEEASQRIYQAEVVGRPHQGVHTGRFRQEGGTTTRWGGQALALTPIDFEARSWVPMSGWPITAQEIDPYYPAAMEMMSLQESLSDEEIWRDFKTRPPTFEDGNFDTFLTRWSPHPNFAKLYAADLKKSRVIRLLLHANVTQIVPDDSRAAIKEIEVKSLSRKRGVIRADTFILSCGGIENARLLLASNRVIKEGLGNRHGWVGKCFQDHLGGPVATVKPRDRKAFAKWNTYFYKDGLKYLPKIQASDKLQRNERILNVAGNFVFQSAADSVLTNLKEIASHFRYGRKSEITLVNLLRAISKATAGFPELADYFLRGRGHCPTRGQILLWAHVEQPPSLDRKIELGSEVDALGMPRCRLIWEISDLERLSIKTFIRQIDMDFQAMGIGIVDPLPEWTVVNENSDHQMTDSNHHIGTTRMAASPLFGVTDENCRVFGLSNLFISGSSLFPTSGHSNPTLALLALAIRLARHLSINVARDTLC